MDIRRRKRNNSLSVVNDTLMLDQSSNHVSLSLASNEDEKVPEVEEDYKNEFDIPEAKHSKKSSSKFYLQISSHACLSFMKSYQDSIILMCR